MWPSILVGKEDNPVSRPPAEVGSSIRRGHRAGERLRRSPQALRSSCRCVGGPDFPRVGSRWQDRVWGSTRGRHSHERDAPAIRRPAWRPVARECRHEPGDRGTVIRIDADEGVIAAIGNEREPGAVRRPARIAVLAAHCDQRLGRCGSVEGSRPDLAALAERHDVAAWRNHRLISIADRLWLAAVERHAEDLHLGRRGVRVDVDRERVVPVRAVVAAAHVHDKPSIRRDRDAGQLLPVIAVVVGQLPRGECGPLGDINVSPALFVERPRDASARRGGGQLGGVGIGPDLIERELGRCYNRQSDSEHGSRNHAPHNRSPFPIPRCHSTWSTARNASCGISTVPTCFIRFFPSFCFSRSLRLRVTSPP